MRISAGTNPLIEKKSMFGFVCVGAFFHQHKHIHHFFWPKCYSNGTIRKPKKRMGAKEKRVRQKHNFHTHFLGRLVTYTHRKTNSTEQRRKKISIAWYLLTGIDSAFMPLHHKPKGGELPLRLEPRSYIKLSFCLFFSLSRTLFASARSLGWIPLCAEFSSATFRNLF